MEQGRILVTGATGFVGRHVVRHFLSAGRLLTLTVRSGDACPPSWRGDERLRIVATGPIETATNLGEALAGASTVVHLAGLANVRHAAGTDDPFMVANAIATQKLAKTASDHGVRAFIHMSSLFAVTNNTSSTVIDDATDGTPSTAYGRSKRMAEKHVRDLVDTGMFAVSLRPTLIIGADAGGNWKALVRLAATGLPLPFASIDNRRSMISVGSVVEAVAHLCATRWPPEKSGDYCLADTGVISLPRTIGQLRAGMGMPRRLFSFPPAVLRGVGELVGQRNRVNGLFGDLQVDAGRFIETFGFNRFADISHSVRESGASYRKSANDRAAG